MFQKNCELSFPFACNQSPLGLKNNNIWYKEQVLCRSTLTSLTIWPKYENVWLLEKRPVTIICALANLDWIRKWTHKIPLAISGGLLNLMFLVPQCIITYFSEAGNNKLSTLQITCSAQSLAIPRLRTLRKKNYAKHY